MLYSVYQHWDPLKVCIVGKSYSPEFYSFITNTRVRSVMERIAQETEEDYQKLISLLKQFNVEVLRPNVKNDVEFNTYNGISSNCIARLNSNGTLDTSFNPGLDGANHVVKTIALQSNGKNFSWRIFYFI